MFSCIIIDTQGMILIFGSRRTRFLVEIKEYHVRLFQASCVPGPSKFIKSLLIVATVCHDFRYIILTRIITTVLYIYMYIVPLCPTVYKYIPLALFLVHTGSTDLQDTIIIQMQLQMFERVCIAHDFTTVIPFSRTVHYSVFITFWSKAKIGVRGLTFSLIVMLSVGDPSSCIIIRQVESYFVRARVISSFTIKGILCPIIPFV